MQTTGVPREVILRCNELFEWDGDHLRVWMYPFSQENACKNKRKNASAAGVTSGDARRKLAEERKQTALESAWDKGKTAERPLNENTEVVQQKRKETEKESGTETQTPNQAQGDPPTSAKPAGAAPLSVSVSNFCQAQTQILNLNQTSALSSPPAEEDATCLAGFEEFWTNYPRKDARRKAEQAWRNVKGRERPRLVQLMQALGRQSSRPAWRKQDGRFIPPARDLDQRPTLGRRRHVCRCNSPRDFTIALGSALAPLA